MALQPSFICRKKKTNQAETYLVSIEQFKAIEVSPGITQIWFNLHRPGEPLPCLGQLTLTPEQPAKKIISFSSIKDSMSLLQPTSNSVELCRSYEYVMYVLSVKFKHYQCPSIQIMQGNPLTSPSDNIQ